jgi:twinkle protein
MAGVCIDKLPHDCGTRHGLQVFADVETGKVDGFCFSCRKWVAEPYGKKVTADEIEIPKQKTEDEIQTEIAEVSGYQFLDIPTRKLRAGDLQPFNIRVAISEEDGKTPVATYFPITKEGKISGYYVKTLGEKHTWSIGDVKNGDLFNWENAKRSGAYRIIITEGFEDAASVAKIYKTYGKEDFQPAVVSLPNGVNSVKCLARFANDLRKLFREVVLCFDNDKPGEKAVEDAMILLPFAKVITLPEKDANECVIKGAQKAAFKAMAFDAIVPKNTRLIFGEDLHLAAREPTPFGELTWPYPTMDKLLRGIRYGETIYIGAGVKMGKSELLNDIAAHFMKTHDVKVFMAKPEEANKKTYKLICNKMVGKVFHDPEVDFDYEAYDKAGEMLKGKLMMVDLYQHLGWENLSKDIISAAALGAKAVFIDPITNLTNGMTAGDANSKLQEIAQSLSALAHDLNIVIFIFCHLKEPEGNISRDVRNKKYAHKEYVGLGNCPHEAGGDVLSAHFAGSRAMMRSCNLMIGLEGNKDPELPEDIRAMRWLTVLEDREFGNTGKIPLFWNRNTTLYKEV